MTPIPQHSLLPPAAIAALVRAAGTPIPDWDPLARIKAIENATERIRAAYPHLFQPTQE